MDAQTEITDVRLKVEAELHDNDEVNHDGDSTIYYNDPLIQV